MKTQPVIYRHSFTEKLAFPAKPDAATRAALRAAGWRYNGLHWWKNANATRPIKTRELSTLLAEPVTA